MSRSRTPTRRPSLRRASPGRRATGISGAVPRPSTIRVDAGYDGLGCVDWLDLTFVTAPDPDAYAPRTVMAASPRVEQGDAVCPRPEPIGHGCHLRWRAARLPWRDAPRRHDADGRRGAPSAPMCPRPADRWAPADRRRSADRPAGAGRLGCGGRGAVRNP